ncbi:MAG: hypothetical protein C5B46_06420 [Proteobacteria bacterium]|nr:MAG: hypothetical protein C5B46_06420 [Pseudomonadota bacterium]
MRNLFSTLFAAALFALVPLTSYAVDQGDSIKTSRPPYKPGREIDSNAMNAAGDDSKPVKHANAPYKPGREIDGDASAESSKAAASSDEGGQPVRPSQPPYKPGRQADDKQ